jgi:Glycosyl transferases group 1
METSSISVLLVGRFATGSLERSYSRALKQLGHSVSELNLNEIITDSLPRAPFVGQVHRYIGLGRWQTRVSKRAFELAMQCRPSAMLLFGADTIDAGTAAQIAVSTGARSALVWPDPLINLRGPAINTISAVDLVATYSAKSLEVIGRLGNVETLWLPFAGDPALHDVSISAALDDATNFGADVAFVGAWRPERQRSLERLADLDLRIWGTGWGKQLDRKSRLYRCFQGKPAIGDDFVRVIRNSKVNLNIVDSANYPAANMRLFELSLLGACQVATPCPEMAEHFVDRQHIRYANESDLDSTVCELLGDPAQRERLGVTARETVLSEHLYTNRCTKLLQRLLPANFPESHG